MSLDDYLAPVKASWHTAKWIDEQVLRQYTKVTNLWEGKGSRYTLAHIFNFSSTLSFAVFSEISHVTLISPLALLATDLARNVFEPFERNEGTGEIAQHPVKVLYTSIGNLIRLPSFLFGVSMIGKSTLSLVDYLKTKDTNSLMAAAEDFSLGYSFFGLASSIYVKDFDPKLLDKPPFWKQAMDYIKEKLSPQPVPVPIPINNKTTLEAYVNKTLEHLN